MSATHPHLSSPVVLCVETEDSGFATSSVVFNSGDFRVISATNPTTALKALTVLRVDAVVFDIQALPEQGFDLSERLRQIAPTVPHVLVCSSSSIKDSADPAILTYIVHADTLVSRLKILLNQTVAGAAQVQKSAERSWQLLTAQQQLWEELQSQMDRLKSAVRRRKGGSEEKTQDNANLEPSGFAHLQLQDGVQISACTRCRAVVGIGDSPADLEVAERSHRCPKAPRQVD